MKIPQIHPAHSTRFTGQILSLLLAMGTWAFPVLAGEKVETESAVVDAEISPTNHQIESSNYDADFSPGEATTNAEAELDEIYGDNDGYFDESPGFRLLEGAREPLQRLYDKTGFRLGFANTFLFMQPFGGRTSEYGAAGDFDIMTSWTLIGRGTENTGRLVATGEYRYQLGDQTPADLRGRMGTLIAPANAFNDRQWVVRDLYWVQRLLEGRLRFIIGRADPSDYVGAFWLQNVNNSFVNRHFSANPTVPFPGHGPLLGVSIRPTDACYLTGGISNAYSTTTRAELDTISDWDLFYFGEAGYTPTIPKLGAGRYAVGLWHIDSRPKFGLPSDFGFTAIADQNLTENLQVFARYGYSDGKITNVRQLAQTGLGYSGLFGRSSDLTGAAVSLATPRSAASSKETVLEGFHRFQVATNTQFTVGMQLIANPGNADTDGAAGVFYMRLRTAF